MQFWSVLAPKLARLSPKGISLEDYTPFARTLGADVILVPNLETSSIDEQVAWFRKLASEGALPSTIELGNEFYLAMVDDPQVMRKWPDEPSTMAVLRQYEEALRPIVGPGAKFAVQSAGSAFWVNPADRRPFLRRQLQWDAELKPAAWFEAVTVHLYPDLPAIAAQPGGNTSAGLFGRLMGRGSEGVDRVLDDIAHRVPGKEIWITEWNPRGGAPTDPRRPEAVTPAMMPHLVAQMSFAYLRHKEVTRALYFMLFFKDGNVFQAYVGEREGRIAPLPATVVLGWFDHAANSGATFQRLVERDAAPIGFADGEHYRPVEAGLLRSRNRSTLIVENASADARLYDPTNGGRGPAAKTAEILATPDLADTALRPAQVITVPADRPVVLPPHSVVRIVWE